MKAARVMIAALAAAFAFAMPAAAQEKFKIG